AQGSRTSTALVYVCKANENSAAYAVNSYPPGSLSRLKRSFCLKGSGGIGVQLGMLWPALRHPIPA
ncbi:hypothetical protein KUCAC02_026079, partial [Chaenocephalus aceratus]